MRGSAVYGKGYHDGSHDTRVEDLIIAGVVAGTVVIVSGGVKLYRKAKQVHAARLEQRMKDVDDSDNPDDPDDPEQP